MFELSVRNAIISLDGNAFCISDGGCIAHPPTKVVFNEVFLDALRQWNKQYPSDSIHDVNLHDIIQLTQAQLTRVIRANIELEGDI